MQEKGKQKEKLWYALQFLFPCDDSKNGKNRSNVAMHLMVLAHVPMVTSRSHSHSAQASGSCMCAAVQRARWSKGDSKYGQF